MNKKELLFAIISIAIFIVCIFVLIFIIPTNAGADYTYSIFDESVENQCHVVMATPTPTMEPTETPIPTSPPIKSSNTAGSEGDSHAITEQKGPNPEQGFFCPSSIKPVLLQGWRRNSPTSITFFWYPTDQVDHYSAIYGTSPNSLTWGLPFIPNTSTSIELDALPVNQIIWTQIWSFKGACVEKSNIFDP